MGDRRVGPSGPTLEAGGVVVDRRAVGRVVGEERLGTVSTLLEVAGLEQGKQRREQPSVTRDPIVPSASPELLLIPVSWPISSSSYPQCRAHAATRVVSVFPVGRDKASVDPLTHAPTVHRDCRIRSRALRRAGPTDWPS
jgi:hypothetical protein